MNDYDEDEWSFCEMTDDEDSFSSFCVLSTPPSVCSLSDVSFDLDSEPVLENKAQEKKAGFVFPTVKRKSKFRYKKRLPDQAKRTFSLAELSELELEIYERHDDKCLLLTLLATERQFDTSQGKIDMSLWKFLKCNLVKKVVDDLLPSGSALILWCNYPSDNREKWLQDKHIKKAILTLLQVDGSVTDQTLTNIQTEEELEILMQESENPWKRALILGNFNRDGCIDGCPVGWSCDRCTFRNSVEAVDVCQMCGAQNDYPKLTDPMKLPEWNSLMDIDLATIGKQSR